MMIKEYDTLMRLEQTMTIQAAAGRPSKHIQLLDCVAKQKGDVSSPWYMKCHFHVIMW